MLIFSMLSHTDRGYIMSS